MSQNLAFEKYLADGMAAVLRSAGIPCVTAQAASPARTYPTVLIEAADVESAISSGNGSGAGVFRCMIYLHCDTYLANDANGAGNAALVSNVRNVIYLPSILASLAAAVPLYTFYAVRAVKTYPADEIHLRRVTMELEAVFAPTT